MWTDETADDGGFRPLLAPDGNRLGFAAWYRAWIEKAEHQVHSLPRGDQRS